MTTATSIRAIGSLLLLMVANFVFNVLVFYFALKLLAPASAARGSVIFGWWFASFIIYLVILYRGVLLQRWPRVLRTLTFCIIAFAAAEVCGVSASHVAQVLLVGHA
jgi:hypothetical protein